MAETTVNTIPISFNRDEELGRGYFAIVYKGECWIPEKLTVAVKRVSRQKSEEFFNVREVGIMRELDHPNVVKFYGENGDYDFWYVQCTCYVVYHSIIFVIPLLLSNTFSVTVIILLLIGYTRLSCANRLWRRFSYQTIK